MLSDYENAVENFKNNSKKEQVDRIADLADIDRKELGSRTQSQLIRLYRKLIKSSYDSEGNLS